MAAVLNMAEGAAPGTPGAGTHNLYVDTSHDWHILDDEGNDHTLATTDYQFDTAAIADEAVTNAKLAQMEEATIKGRAASAGTGAADDLTAEEVVTLLTDAISDVMDDVFLPVGDASWTALTLNANYNRTNVYPSTETFLAPSYRKIGTLVYLRGAATSSAAGAMATLPVGYRPAYACAFIISYSTGSGTNGYSRCIVDTDGTITVSTVSGHTDHLDGCVFPLD